MKMISKSKGKFSGFTLLEGLLGLMLFCNLLALGVWQLNRQIDRQTEQAVAEQLVEVARCVRRYVAENFNKLLRDATPSGVQVIKIEDLRSNGYLDSSFPGIDKGDNLKNLFGQEYKVHLRLKSFRGNQASGSNQGSEVEDSRQLQILLLTSDGEPIQEGSLLRIVRAAGASAGWVKRFTYEELQASGQFPPPGQPILLPGQQVNKIIGLQQGWELDVPKIIFKDALTGKSEERPLTEAGRLAHLSYLSSSDIADSHAVLHRLKDPNHKLNFMETDLEMRACDINFVGKEDNDFVCKSQLTAGHIIWMTTGAKQGAAKSVYYNSYLGVREEDNGGQKEVIPILELRNGEDLMRATHDGVQFNVESPKTEDKVFFPAEMSRGWHKLPYYEFNPVQTNSAKGIKALDDTETTEELEKHAYNHCRGESHKRSLGRMFLMGAKEKPWVDLYICILHFTKNVHGVESDGEVKAVRLSRIE